MFPQSILFAAAAGMSGVLLFASSVLSQTVSNASPKNRLPRRTTAFVRSMCTFPMKP